VTACDDSSARKYNFIVSTDRQNHRPGRYASHGELTDAAVSVLSRVNRIDNTLNEEAWVIPSKYLERGSPDDVDTRFIARFDYPRLVDSEEAVTWANELAAKYLKMFGDSLKSQADALVKSKALLDKIIAQEKVDVEMKGRKTFYYVTGLSGRRYSVEQGTGSVTDMASGGHICIVNGGSRDLGGYDYLASVIAALAADSLTAQRVGTLASYVDRDDT
ncbi:MAG: hypothetical protein V3T31_00285, partial [candidate division Zixibacteria bacterium]